MLASAQVSSRISKLRPTVVNAILAEVREYRSKGLEPVSLMRGEPDFRSPQHVVEACTRALRNGRTAYPDNRGELKLREAVTQKLLRDNKLDYDPATEVLVTTGATQGVYAALMATINPGDEVLVPDPIYDAYESPIRMAGGCSRAIPSVIAQGRFVVTEEALEAVWSPSARALILNTPWNPVGTVLRRPELESIASFCRKRNLILISDEIYEAITYGDAEHISPLLAAGWLREQAIVVNSLSKTYAMTGWRVGYCAGPAHLIQAMFLVLAQSSRGPATFIQDAAAEALMGPQNCVQDMRAEYAHRRDQVKAGLNGIPNVTLLAPEGGFFAMADVRELNGNSDQIRKRLLWEHGVVVVHGSAYGPSGEHTLRISFASGGEVLERGIERLRTGLRAIGPRR